MAPLGQQVGLQSPSLPESMRCASSFSSCIKLVYEYYLCKIQSDMLYKEGNLVWRLHTSAGATGGTGVTGDVGPTGRHPTPECTPQLGTDSPSWR